MNVLEDENISKKEISEFKRLALHNKKDVMYKKLRIKLENEVYDFIIKGIGQKAVKLELYCYYGSILTNKNDGVIEKRLYDIISAIYENGKEVKLYDEVSA